MIKNSSLISNLFGLYEYHSTFPIHISIDCMASLSWTKIMKGKRSYNGDQKDNSISQQAKGLQIAHSLLTMILCNSMRTVNAGK